MPKNEAQRDKLVFEGNQTSAILLSQQCFRGCSPLNSQETQVIIQPSETDHLEDGILNDSQKLEFLPKFLSGKAYEVLGRVSGCSYDSILRI